MIRKIEVLGFIAVRQKGSHRFYKNILTGNTTVIPIHSKEIGKGLLRKILRDCDLSVEEFVEA